MRADFLDRYARGNTYCHRLAPRTKIVGTALFVLSVLVIPISLWPLYGVLACLVFVGHVVAEIPTRYLLHRLLLLLPPVAGVALAAPVSNRFHHGWDLAATIALRSTLSFLAGLWLVNTTPFEKLLSALAQMGLPRAFIELLAFMYRYCFVVFDEYVRMRTAQRARTMKRVGIFGSWIAAASLLGTLLIRSLNRAERIHGAMCSRGWSGKMPE